LAGRRQAGSPVTPDIHLLIRAGGFSLVDPGLVWIPQWRPDSPADVPDNPRQFWGLVGVGRR